MLFIRYVLSCWDFRKVYFEGPEFNTVTFASAIGKSLDLEGVLKQHDYYDGRYWDVHILALYRDRFPDELLRQSLSIDEGQTPE